MKKAEFLLRVGNNIRQIRKSKGLTVQALADLVDMEKSNLIPMEKGRGNLKLSTILKLATALDVDPQEFFK